jgi:HK97 gp10 family phage protein
MDVKASIKIDPKLFKLKDNANKGIIAGLKVCALETHKEISNTRLYKDRTGFLRKSVTPEPVNEAEKSVKVVANAEYAGYVNDGTRYIKARQFMEAGLEIASRRFKSIFENTIGRALR